MYNYTITIINNGLSIKAELSIHARSMTEAFHIAGLAQYEYDHTGEYPTVVEAAKLSIYNQNTKKWLSH